MGCRLEDELKLDICPNCEKPSLVRIYYPHEYSYKCVICKLNVGPYNNYRKLETEWLRIWRKKEEKNGQKNNK